MTPSSKSSNIDAQAWTSRALLRWMTDRFQSRGLDSPRVVAEMLLAHVIGCERMRLYMEVDRPASQPELAQLRGLVARASNHEPVQYLVGHAWFFGRKIEVDGSTLIPRPSTETLVEHVLQWLRINPGHSQPLMADIGTGTGCIAISLAAQLREAQIVATDIVPQALELARRNARLHNVEDRIDFREGDSLEPLLHGGERFDVICSNPPYISEAEWAAVADNVKRFEPQSALRGGPDGMAVIRPMISQAPALLKHGGLLAIEIADSQRDEALALANAHGQLVDLHVTKDHEGHWRVLTGVKK